ncbi:MAG: prefoldin subunit beta [Nanoarchaeota archaeon]|nr:prefoldin subunit beta [Nanoarchaeota archaeon]
MKMTPDIKEKLMKMQQLQQQLEILMYQKQGISVNVAEIENALKELEATKDKEVYEVVGSIMLKRKSEDLKKKLSEKKDVTEIRKTSLDKQIGSLAEQLKKLREEINQALPKKG